MFQTFDAKFHKEFTSDFVVLTVYFWKNLFLMLNSTLIISFIILLERLSFILNSSTTKLLMFLWWIQTNLSFLSKLLKELL